MKNAKFYYVAQIEKKNYKDFDSLFESDEFYNIQDMEIKRMTFYYFALKFSSLPNKNITELYKDLKTILEKMQSNKFLQKYDEKVYPLMINKYLEKIEIFNASMEFYENEKNIYIIKELIKLFNNHFKKFDCPKSVFESLKDLYDIFLIKKNHKIPEKHQKMIDRYLKDYKKLLDFLSQKYNFDIKEEKEKEAEKEREKENDKRKNIQNINENINEKINISKNNKNNFNDKNIDKTLHLNNNINKNNNSNNNYFEKNTNNLKENLANKKDESNIFYDLNNFNNQKTINNIDFNNINNNISKNKNNFQINNKIINDIDNINLNNENNNPSNLSKNSGKLIYEPEGLDFAKNLIEGLNKENKNKSNNINNIIIQEKDNEKSYTNDIHDNSSNKINIDININPFKEKKEQEEIDNLKKIKNSKKEKKKKKKIKNEEKFKEYMACAKNINIEDF